MEEQKPFEFKRFKSWMLVTFLVALLLVGFNFDPVGDGLEKIFGRGADKWAINIVITALIIYTFVKKK